MALKDALKIGSGKNSPTNEITEDVQRRSPVQRAHDRHSPLGEQSEAREVPKNVLRFPVGPKDMNVKGFESRRHLIVR